MPTPTWYEADTDDEDRHVIRLTPQEVAQIDAAQAADAPTSSDGGVK